jgi:hypothetical protein
METEESNFHHNQGHNLFVLAAIGFCILSLFERGGRWQVAGVGFYLVTLATCVYGYYERFYPIAARNNQSIMGVSQAIRNVTQLDEVVVVNGAEWSSEIPYYSRRRALMFPSWLSLEGPEMKATLQMVSEYHIGAIAFCFAERDEGSKIDKVTKLLKFQMRPVYQDEMCEIYSPDRLPKHSPLANE